MKGQKTKEKSNLKKHQDYIHTRLDSFCAGIVWTVTAQGSTSPSHTLNIVPARLTKRAWCTQFQSLILNIYFRLGGFQLSLLLIYFRDRPKRCSQHPKLRQKIYPICVSVTPLSRSARCNFAPSQKLCHHNHSCVRTEAPPSLLFMATQKLFSRVRT